MKKILLPAILGVISSTAAWAVPASQTIICNSSSELVQTVNALGKDDPAAYLWAPGPASSPEKHSPSLLLRVMLERLILGGSTGVYDARANNRNLRDVLHELGDPKGIAVRPGAEGCIELYVGEEARSLSR